MISFKKSIISLFIIISLAKVTFSFSCYSCASYPRLLDDYVYSSSCSSPNSTDQANACTGAYCFKSTVLLADLSTAVIRGCSTGNKPSDVENRLTGYQSQINFCNSADYCNSAKRNNLSEVSLAVLIITTFFFY